MSEWEVVCKAYKNDTTRMKVDGGWLYRSISYDKVLGSFNTPTSESIAFVPEIDLQRYQAHLRDAYKQGYENGQQDAKHGIQEAPENDSNVPKFDDAEPKSIEEAEAIHHIPEEVIYS